MRIYNKLRVSLLSLGFAAVAAAAPPPAPPTVTKSFSSYAIHTGDASTVTFKLNNATATTYTNVTVSDTLPAGLVVANPPAVTNTCGGTVVNLPALTPVLPGDFGFLLGGLTLAPAATCSFSVKVTSSTIGTYDNTGALTYNVGPDAGSAPTNTASLQVLALMPTVSAKSFASPTVALGGTVLMNLSITNPNTVTVQAFVVDHPPAGMHFVVQLPPTSGNACGVLSITPSTYTINANLVPGGNCSSTGIMVVADTLGPKVNITDPPAIVLDNTFDPNIGFTHTLVGAPATASVNVVPPPPTVTKSLSPALITAGSTSTVTFQLSNTTASTITNIDTLDLLAPNLFVAGPAVVTNTCGGVVLNNATLTPLVGGETGFLLAGVSLAPGGSCNFTVKVTSAIPNSYGNAATVNYKVGTDVGAITSNAVSLLVVAPPTVTKTFSPSLIPVGNGTQVTIAIHNPNTVALANAVITDTLPAGLVLPSVQVITSTGCVTPTPTATPATGLVSFNTLFIDPGATCMFMFSVGAPGAGVFTNTTSTITSKVNIAGQPDAPVGAAATAVLTVVQPVPPTITKVFTAHTLTLGSTTSMTLTLTNPNPLTVSGVAVSDLFPAGLTPSNMVNNCGGTASLVLQQFTLTGVTLAANPAAGHQCTVAFTVTGAPVGLWTNTTGTITAIGPSALTGTTASDSVNVIAAPPATTKTFTPSTIAIADTSVLSITVHNPNPVVMTAVAFTDTMPASLLITTPSVFTATGCGGTVTAAAGTNVVSLSGGSIAANSDCIITVVVQGLAPGGSVNLTSTVTGTVQTANVTGAAATATLQIGPSNQAFYVGYAANLAIGDSVVNMTNTGQFSSIPGVPNAQNGNICANVFTYSPDEQLVSCCSCLVTPNALNSLSVNGDLASNTLTPIKPSAVVMKMVASAPGAGTGSQACNPATVTRAGAANFLVPGLAAWGTTLHALPVTAGAPAGTYGTTETPFLMGTFSDAELTRMTQLCSFIQANGSGYGICKSCEVGGLGAATK